MKALMSAAAALIVLSTPTLAQVSGNISGNVSGSVSRPSQLSPNSGAGGFGSSSGRRYVPNNSGGLVSREEGSSRGWMPDGNGGLVGTGNNAGRRCAPAGGGAFRCY